VSAKRVKHFMVIKVTFFRSVGARVISVMRVTRKLNAERGALVGKGSSIQKRHKQVLASLRPIYVIFGIRLSEFIFLWLSPHFIIFLRS